MKKTLNYSYLIVLFLLFGPANSYGQSKKELSLSLRGGYARLDHKVKKGADCEGAISGLGINYGHYLDQNWSLAIGAEFEYALYRTNFDTLNDTYIATDKERENFEYRYTLKNFKEEQNAFYMNVPLKNQYESLGKQTRFYASAGAGIGFALSSNYKTSAGSLHTSGYYPQYKVELNDPLFIGFGDMGSQKRNKEDLKLGTAYTALLEAGIKQLVNDKNFLYIGLFMDYGLNDIGKGDTDLNVVEYRSDKPTESRYNSLLNSSNKKSKSGYQGTKPFAFGIKLRYTFALGK
jgi:hypothetical protein